MRRTTTVVVCTLALALCAGYAGAQTAPPPDTLKVSYFVNANTAGAPDGTVRMTNPGTSGGNLCAAIYVSATDQELSECCSCFLSPDGLRTLSLNTDLTSDPLTGVLLTEGTVYMVSTKTTSGTCPLPTTLTPTPAVRATAINYNSSKSNLYEATETASQDATFSATEQTRLQNECGAVQLVGSGKGICTCGTGD